MAKRAWAQAYLILCVFKWTASASTVAVSAERECVGLHHTEPAMVFVRLDVSKAALFSIYGTHERYGALWDHRGLIASLGPVR